MGSTKTLALIGFLLGGGAGLFLLGKAVAIGSCSLESVIPGLLALAFATFGGWGRLRAQSSKQAIWALLGSALGGLIAVDLLYVPAAVFLALAAFSTWRA